jgi:probable rRNA maturation factor
MSAIRATAPLRVDLQVAVDGFVVPDDADCRTWVGAALSAGGHMASGVVTVRLVTEDESAELNSSYRDQPGPTNVLAFSGPGDAPAITNGDVAGDVELGDLVICLPVACREADEQGKQPIAHLAHLVVHGTLHLIGYDHEHEADVERMESLEVQVLGGLGFANPYVAPERTNDRRA